VRTYDEQSIDAQKPGAPTPRASDELLSASVSDPPVLTPSTAVHLQRVVGNEVVSRMVEESSEEERSPVLDVVGHGGGHPLDSHVREDMEGRLGQDFSDVRVHTDSAAAASARSVQARAYTVGNEIVFDNGHYQPGSDHGRQTLAHELTHVVQQRSGPVDGTPTDGGIQLSDPSDRFEQQAENNAARAISSNAAVGGAPVQRQGAPEDEEKKKEEETVQGSFVQREMPEEDKREEAPPT
jgi:hypothetical protein